MDEDLRKLYTRFVSKMGDRRMRDRIFKDATGELYISATQYDKAFIGKAQDFCNKK